MVLVETLPCSQSAIPVPASREVCCNDLVPMWVGSCPAPIWPKTVGTLAIVAASMRAIITTGRASRSIMARQATPNADEGFTLASHASLPCWLKATLPESNAVKHSESKPDNMIRNSDTYNDADTLMH